MPRRRRHYTATERERASNPRSDYLGRNRSTRVTIVARLEASSMVERPYILLSCGMSIDGYLDDADQRRLLLSNDADFDRVDEVRAGCDAILVGAGTIRQDDPRLLVRSAGRRASRT